MRSGQKIRSNLNFGIARRTWLKGKVALRENHPQLFNACDVVVALFLLVVLSVSIAER